jgi:hypothetical protein
MKSIESHRQTTHPQRPTSYAQERRLPVSTRQGSRWVSSAYSEFNAICVRDTLLTFQQHVRCRWPEKRKEEVDPLLRERHLNHFLRSPERIRSSATGREQSGMLCYRPNLQRTSTNISQNRMMESLVLFDSVVNSRWFMRTSIVLFLNKVDLFRQKLKKSPLGEYFPDYSGGDDVNRAAKYLLWRFNQVNRAHLNLYPQYVP